MADWHTTAPGATPAPADVHAPAGNPRPRTLPRRFATFLALPPDRRRLAAEAMLLLGAARLLVRLVPLRWYIGALGEREAESPEDLAPGQEAVAREVGWAVRTVAPATPWESVCLPQAMAAKWMLDRRRVPATLYLGAARGDDRALLAHAWLRAGRRILTGRAESARFTRIASFA
jgi:hypothetical protein